MVTTINFALAAVGTPLCLLSIVVSSMLRRMIESRNQEGSSEFPLRKRLSRAMLQAMNRFFVRERQYAEKLSDDVTLAIRSDLESMEERLTARLEEIDVSVNLIGREMSRHSGPRSRRRDGKPT